MGMTAEERLAWWKEARFGMFIHWGLYAIPAGEWKGEKIRGIGEWIMRNAKIPIPEYEALAKQFNPVKFDAEAWAELAREAGMRYLVITAKHHDGFCMFDSPQNPYNIVRQTPFGRDPMKELAAACNRRGIRLCFYYSQAQDWHAPGGAGHWEEASTDKTAGWLGYTRPPEDFQKYLDAVVKPDLQALLTNYGPIGLIWFDTPVAITKQQSESLRDFVHALQPACLVSGRVGHDVGDYGSLGDNEHPVGRVEGAWETPATLNDTWGFKRDDHHWKTVDELLELLVNCASKGVNYLLNVGPTAEGEIPQPSVERLRAVGAWLERNGEAIYGTEASPFLVDPAWGRVTQKGEALYLIVKQWPDAALKVYGLRNRVRSARALWAPEADVDVRQEGDALTLTLPPKDPEEMFPVVALALEGRPEAEQLLIQDGADPIRLPVAVGERTGAVRVRPAGGATVGWTDTKSRISWTFRVRTPGTYEVTALTRVNRNRPELHGNHELRVTVGNEAATGTVGARDLGEPADAKTLQTVSSRVGSLRFEAPGDWTLHAEAVRIDPGAEQGLALVALELTRAPQIPASA